MATQQTSTKKTLLPLYYIKEDPTGGKGRFTRIGCAIENKDGHGWNIMFDVPIVITEQTRLCIREPQERD